MRALQHIFPFCRAGRHAAAIVCASFILSSGSAVAWGYEDHNGAPGADGISGPVATDGEPGGHGQSVWLEQSGTWAGHGGRGGDGGWVIPGPGPGGNGGRGGDGGSIFGESVFFGIKTAGQGGDGGSGYHSGTGGNGGSVIAVSPLTSSYSAIYGGRGGKAGGFAADVGGNGGDGGSTLVIDGILPAFGGRGGNGGESNKHYGNGGRGGDATAISTGPAGSVTGGHGGIGLLGGAGGNAFARGGGAQLVATGGNGGDVAPYQWGATEPFIPRAGHGGTAVVEPLDANTTFMARGGDGGHQTYVGFGGNGGNAIARIPGDWNAVGTVRGGRGGEGQPWDDFAFHRGRTGDGGSASVEFTDSLLAGGELTAIGGNVGLSSDEHAWTVFSVYGARGGNATIDRHATATVFENTVYWQTARGGMVGESGYLSFGGDALSSLVVDSGQNLDVRINAEGYTGGHAVANLELNATGRIDAVAHALAEYSPYVPSMYYGSALATAQAKTTGTEPITIAAVAGKQTHTIFSTAINSAYSHAEGLGAAFSAASAHYPFNYSGLEIHSHAHAKGAYALAQANIHPQEFVFFQGPDNPTRTAHAQTDSQGPIQALAVEMFSEGGFTSLTSVATIGSAPAPTPDFSPDARFTNPAQSTWLNVVGMPEPLAGIAETPSLIAAGLYDPASTWLMNVSSLGDYKLGAAAGVGLPIMQDWEFRSTITMTIDPAQLNANQDLLLAIMGQELPAMPDLPRPGEIRFAVHVDAIPLVDVTFPYMDTVGLDQFFVENAFHLGSLSSWTEPFEFSIQMAATHGAFVPLSNLVLATVPKPGDANGDGQVDGADYVAWATHFKLSTEGGSQAGDFNRDGIVDGSDYVIWANRFQGTASSAVIPVAFTAVPEPHAWLMGLAAFIGGWLIRRRAVV